MHDYVAMPTCPLKPLAPPWIFVLVLALGACLFSRRGRREENENNDVSKKKERKENVEERLGIRKCGERWGREEERCQVSWKGRVEMGGLNQT